MINIGIDVGKFKHCATVLDDSTGEVLIKPFFLTNDRKGFDLLYSKTIYSQETFRWYGRYRSLYDQSHKLPTRQEIYC